MDIPPIDNNMDYVVYNSQPSQKTNAQVQKECGEYCASLTKEDINKINQAVFDHREFL